MTENEAIKRVREFGLRHAIGKLPHSWLAVQAFETAILALEEIQQYRALGTVEELREAREKQRIKEPLIQRVSKGIIYKCPCCKKIFAETYKNFKRGYIPKYCETCGQSIDS